MRMMQRIYDTLCENRKLPMTNEQLSDHGVDLHHLDIRTGATSPSTRSYFLPRAEFPELTDSESPLDSPLFEFGILAEEPSHQSQPLNLEAIKTSMFPDCMTYNYRWHSFEGDGDLISRFINRYSYPYRLVIPY